MDRDKFISLATSYYKSGLNQSEIEYLIGEYLEETNRKESYKLILEIILKDTSLFHGALANIIKHYEIKFNIHKLLSGISLYNTSVRHIILIY